jgi:uncharacterized membrane protein
MMAAMSKGRAEAFSDGVAAVIITIMVLEMTVPHGTHLSALTAVIPVFLSYCLSFVYVGIYWNNHHHLFQAVQKVDGAVLWANLHWLFWLPLLPFVTGWMGENGFAAGPVAVYGVVLLLIACAYGLLTRTLVRHHSRDSVLARSIGRDRKGNISIAIYAVAIPLTAVAPWASCLLYALVAAMWLVPDRRIEHAFEDKSDKERVIDERGTAD